MKILILIGTMFAMLIPEVGFSWWHHHYYDHGYYGYNRVYYRPYYRTYHHRACPVRKVCGRNHCWHQRVC